MGENVSMKLDEVQVVLAVRIEVRELAEETRRRCFRMGWKQYSLAR